MGEDTPAIVVGGFLAALATVRNLGSYGVDVYFLSDSDRESMGNCIGYSRHCLEFIERPEANLHEAWLEWFTHRGPRSGVILPCSDEGVAFIANHRDGLVRLGYSPVDGCDSTAANLLDKEHTYEVARRIGVATPASAILSDVADVAAVVEAFQFPVVVKPTSRGTFLAREFGWKARSVPDADTLADLVERATSKGFRLQATEEIPGGEDQFCSYYSVLDENGEPLLHFTKRKLRQYPLGFGWGTFHLTDWNDEVAELGLRFFTGSGLGGIGNVEFKRDPRDGQLKLIECNPRLTDATELICQSGLELPLFLYRRTLGQSTPSVESYRRGMVLWRLPQDLLAAGRLWRRGDLSWRVWASQVVRRHRYAIFSWRDPKPSLLAFAFRVRSTLLKVAPTAFGGVRGD